jgi:uncharacterized protein
MVNVDAPGVYVLEERSLAPPIQGIGTSTALFIAPCPGAPHPLDRPKSVTNPTEFLTHFRSDRPEARHLINSALGFFRNGGQRLYVVAVADAKGIAGDPKRRTGLESTRGIDEIALVAAPGVTDIAAQRAIVDYCEEMDDRFAILDMPEKIDDLDLLTRGPNIQPPQAVGGGGDGGGQEDRGGFRLASENGVAASYFPWIVVSDYLTREPVTSPPSGFVAGVFARTDATRGVHKAPANEIIRDALGVTYNTPQAELGMLNRNGINVIRSFPRRGIRIWGARTLADPASDWRYVNVRRFVIYLKGSLRLGLMSAVHESNDRFLQERLRAQITSFLLGSWRSGALVGATPEQAFFVKCDDENNPPDVVANGQIIVDVGLAVVRPAEFVIVRLSQWSGGGRGSGATQ